MENNEQRPSAALINREWFESASGILSRQDLGLVLVQCVEYVFGIGSGFELRDTPEVVFKMVRPSLDSDITKYRERCARNAANARSRSERVAASGSEWQRVGANTTTTPTTTSTTTSTTTPSLSPEVDIEREKWLVYGYFWSTGSKAITEECTAFWSYYESLGWRNNKGAAIVSKLAAARMWRRQFETGQAPNGAEPWFKVVQSCRIADYRVWDCFAGAERKDDHAIIRLRCSEKYRNEMIAAVPELESRLRAIWRVVAIDWAVAG